MACKGHCKDPTPAQAHCSVCHATFGGITSFTDHRKNGQCVEPLHAGLVLSDGVWRTPISDADRTRLLAIRSKARSLD